MRRVALFLTVLFAVNLINLPANSAVKAGTKCAKAGTTSISGGKKYTCVKSGKNLVWNKGVLIPKPVVSATPTSTNSPTPVATPTPTPEVTYTIETYPFKHPCDTDPFVPPQWAEYQVFAKKTFGCSRPLQFVDVALPANKPISTLTANSDNTTISECKIPETNTRNVAGNTQNVGHRNQWKFSGDLKVQVVPVQFTDFNTTKSPTEEYGKYFDYMKEMFYKISDGNTRLNFEVPSKYLQINSTIESFNTGGTLEKNGKFSWKLLDTPRYQSAIFAVADPVMNFTGVKLNILIVPLSVPDVYIAHSPKFRMDNVQTNEGVVPANYIMPPASMGSDLDWFGVEPFLHLHEIFHATGMLSDHLGDSDQGGTYYGTGRWGNMSGMQTDFITWDKWLSGMLSDSQVICASKKATSTYWIKPATYFGQYEKLLAIPVSNTKVIVVESQRKAGMNYKLTSDSEGALVYTIDTMDTRYDSGIDVLKPTSRTSKAMDGPFVFWDAPLKLNEFINIWGYKISVIETGKFGDVVKVEKV